MLHELREMGIEGGEPGYLGVTASLTQEEAYRVVYGSRLASRLLRTLATFSCYDDNELYDKASRFNWKALIRPGQTFKINATVSDSGITHSQYAMLRLKDAVVDSLRDESGTRPDVDRDNPDIRIDLFLRQDQATSGLAGTLERLRGAAVERIAALGRLAHRPGQRVALQRRQDIGRERIAGGRPALAEMRLHAEDEGRGDGLRCSGLRRGHRAA